MKGEVSTLTASMLMTDKANVDQVGPAVVATDEGLVWITDSCMSALG